LIPIYPVALFFETMNEAAPFLSDECFLLDVATIYIYFEALNTHLQMLNIFQML